MLHLNSNPHSRSGQLAFCNYLAIFLICSVAAIECRAAESAASIPAPVPPSAALAKPVELDVAPRQPVLTGARAVQRLLVTGRFDGGRERDVTGRCRFESANPKVADVSADGIVRPVANGTAVIRVHVDDMTIETKVTVQRIEDNSFNFANHVLPVISRLHCNQMGCHGSPKGKAGMRLSLFGADPVADHFTITRASLGRRIMAPLPRESLFLLKGAATVPHEGGPRIDRESASYQLLVDWIGQNAPKGDADDPVLERIEVFPSQRTVVTSQKQRLLVQAHYSDGTMADVTHLASYTSNDEMIATVSEDGVVAATGTGEAVVVVAYSGLMVNSRFAVPRPSTQPYPDVVANNRVDELVFAKLRSLNIVPSPLCSDSEFIRRVYLDVLGALPTPDESRRFLSDTNANKRAKLIDELLNRSEYVDRWTVKWCDLLRVNRSFPANLGEQPMWAYYDWVRSHIARNTPMDRFVSELITATGSSELAGPANFFRVARDAQSMAEQTSALFLGVRLDCARCHNHPFEQLTWDDNLGMAAFFSRVKHKRGVGGIETVYERRSGTIRHPKTGAVMPPQVLRGEYVASGGDASVGPRAQLAKWITSPDNPWFARNMSNRVWFWLFGRGIVHEPDDFRSTNPPSNPQLLDYIAKQFADNGFDTKYLFRLILNSRTYQLSARPNETNAKDHVHFSHYPIKRLDAEQTLDVINQLVGTTERFGGLPVGMRASQLPDPAVRSSFLDLFGRPKRSTTCECERSAEMHVGQMLHLISSDHMESKLAARGSRLDRLIAEKKTDEQIIDEFYLAAFSRTPTAKEKQMLLARPLDAKNRRAFFEDLLWALMNTKEFSFNH